MARQTQFAPIHAVSKTKSSDTLLEAANRWLKYDNTQLSHPKFYSMKNIAWLFDPRPWIVIVLIQVPSLQNYFSVPIIPYPSLALFTISMIILIVIFIIFHSQFKQLAITILASPITFGAIFFTFWLLGLLIYARMEGINIGGTGDDAMQVPVIAMLQGRWLYDVTLFDGALISPGLGWLMLNSPFTVLEATEVVGFVWTV